MIIHDNRFGGLCAFLSIALKLMCLYTASIKLIIQISDKSKDLLDEGQIQLQTSLLYIRIIWPSNNRVCSVLYSWSIYDKNLHNGNATPE